MKPAPAEFPPFPPAPLDPAAGAPPLAAPATPALPALLAPPAALAPLILCTPPLAPLPLAPLPLAPLPLAVPPDEFQCPEAPAADPDERPAVELESPLSPLLPQAVAIDINDKQTKKFGALWDINRSFPLELASPASVRRASLIADYAHCAPPSDLRRSALPLGIPPTGSREPARGGYLRLTVRVDGQPRESAGVDATVGSVRRLG